VGIFGPTELGKPAHIIGLDLGQSKDYTALVLVERTWEPDDDRPYGQISHYGIRYLKRWQLGTPYTQIVQDVDELVATPPLRNPLMAVDRTGVGWAVVDMFRQARIAARLRPILITAGSVVTADSGWHVPKKELVSTLQTLLQGRRLKIADLPERSLLKEELLKFKVKINVATANESFEAWRERDHDDLVLATCLALWLAEQEQNQPIDVRPVPNPPRRGIGGARTGEIDRRAFGAL
jgi:hypothetical protein